MNSFAVSLGVVQSAEGQITSSPLWRMQTVTENKGNSAGDERYSTFISSYCTTAAVERRGDTFVMPGMPNGARP